MTGYTAEARSQLDADSGSLNAAEVMAWAGSLPPGAQITAVMGERGSQRDPEPFLRCLVATWSMPIRRSNVD